MPTLQSSWAAWHASPTPRCLPWIPLYSYHLLRRPSSTPLPPTCLPARLPTCAPSCHRLDTCTKFLAPGLRLGWAVAAPAVIGKMTDLLQGQTLGASGLSQVCTSLSRSGRDR